MQSDGIADYVPGLAVSSVALTLSGVAAFMLNTGRLHTCGCRDAAGGRVLALVNASTLLTIARRMATHIHAAPRTEHPCIVH